MTIVEVDSTYGPVEFDLEVVTPYFENQDPAWITTYLKRHVEAVAIRFDTIKEVVADFLPARSLDIGCGLAVIDVFLARAGVSTIRLMDGAANIPRITGIKEGTQAWADVGIGTDVVKRNVRGGAVVYRHVADAYPPSPIPVDMIISTRSWGHHYAMSTYLDLARKSLSYGNPLIVDVRTGTNGKQELLDAGFEFNRTLPDRSKKCTRMVFTRRGVL